MPLCAWLALFALDWLTLLAWSEVGVAYYLVHNGIFEKSLWLGKASIVSAVAGPNSIDVSSVALLFGVCGVLCLILGFQFVKLAKKGLLIVVLLAIHTFLIVLCLRRGFPLSAVYTVGVSAFVTILGSWGLNSRLYAVRPNMYSDRVIVITGSAGGMGAEMAKQYAQGGAKLVLFDLKDVKETVTECQNLTGKDNVLGIAGDVTREEDCAYAVDQAMNKFGKVNTLILAAGIPMPHTKFMDVKDMNRFMRVMDVNYKGSVMMTKAFLPGLLQNKKSWIIAFGSASSLFGVPYISGYSASKHAVLGFFDALRIELAHTGCSITVTCPHFVSTEMFNHYNTGLMLTTRDVVSQTRFGSDEGIGTVMVGELLYKFGVLVNTRNLLPGLNDFLLARNMQKYSSKN